MAHAGGSATLYGVLFQILGSVHQACSLKLDAQLRGEELGSARLTLEPADGGDLAVEQPGEVTVEQWKSRRSGRLWSMREIVDGVLPDLYLAVNDSRVGKAATYRFRAEGPVAPANAANDFFRRLREFDADGFSASLLDDSTQRSFLPGRPGRMTDAGFFLWIAARVRTALAPRGLRDADPELHRKLRHLLANFEVPPPLSAPELEHEIDRLLIHWIDYAEDASAKRAELCGRLLEVAASGHAVIDPKAFLAAAGLTSAPFGAWERVRSNLSLTARRAAAGGRLRYDAALDVREPPAWPAAKPVLVISGPSGSGKSWQLASLLQAADAAEQACVFSESRGDAGQDVEEIARRVWHDGFGHESPPIPLRFIAKRLHSAGAARERSWLAALIDDVDRASEARRLAELPWEEWGVRLAMTVPDDVAKWLAKQGLRRVSVTRTEPFTQRQLREYLRRRNRDWTGIPEDVRDHLTNPLLAGLYCELNPLPTWHPESEYDIFAAVWDRLRSHELQAEHPDDQAAVRALAGGLFAPDAEYPWTLTRCRDVGLDTAAVTRLERVGWLNRVDGGGRVAVRHDRLLNWAAAEALSDRLRFGGGGAVEEVCGLLRESIGREGRPAGQRLGYVFMDLLYLVCAEGHPARPEASRLLSDIEGVFRPTGYPHVLYKELLPTLGDRVTAAIADRARRFTPEELPLPALAADALRRIGSPAAASAAAELVECENVAARATGALTLAKLPDARALDRLWSAYGSLAASPDETAGDRRDRSLREREIAGAIRACAAGTPEWITGRLRTDGADGRAAKLLASCLQRLEGSTAADVWEECRAVLAETLGDGAEQFATCVARFGDSRYLPLLKSWVSSGDPAKVAAGFPRDLRHRSG